VHFGTRQLILTVMLAGMALPPAITPAAEATMNLGPDLQTLLDEVMVDTEIPGALLAVSMPAQGLEWQGAAGVSRIAGNAVLEAGAPVRLASNTKTYVAVTVLRLWEQKELGLDDAVSGYLTSEQAGILRGDGYDLEAITLRHLLTHTAGLVDHGAQQEYMDAILADPRHS